jgi:hypothetical protein
MSTTFVVFTKIIKNFPLCEEKEIFHDSYQARLKSTAIEEKISLPFFATVGKHPADGLEL